MELSEVVNPHFAFPVVGVVLCAVLVFAFGFKSPVQPPTFDYFAEQDDRRQRKAKQRNKKLVANGNISSGDSPSLKRPTVTQQKASPSNKNTVEKAESKPKVKKSAASSPTPKAQLPSQTEAPKQNAEDEGGDWETAQPRKRKQLRKKEPYELERPEIDAKDATEQATVGVAPPLANVQPAAEPVVMQQDKPQEQRQKKGKNRPSKDKEAEAAPQTESSDKENVPEEPQRNVPVQNIHEDAITPKKKKNKKAKAGSPVAEVVAVEQSAPTSTAEAPVTVQADSGASLSSTVNESDSSISKVPVVQADKASDDKKTSKSPKKKKKGKDLQDVSPAPSNMELDSAVARETEKAIPTASQPQAMPSAAQASVKSTPTENIASPLEAVQPASTTPSSPQATPGAAQSNAVSFDELGEWQEAKPVKRKTKKARREN